MFNGIDTKFKETTQPSNIIWENRHIKGINYCSRVTGAFIIMAFMLTITFWVIFAFKQAQINNTKLWPQVDCDRLIKEYSTSSDDKVFKYAQREWF